MKKEPHPMDIMSWKEKQKYKSQPTIVRGTENMALVDKKTNEFVGINNRKTRRKLAVLK